MKYRRLILLILGTTLLFPTLVQADNDLRGTARYVGMGGAFAALGGDVSAIQDNPAALGVFRRQEVSVTFDYSAISQQSLFQTEAKGILDVSQVSWVVSFGNKDKQKGVISNNFVLQYQQLQRYNQKVTVGGTFGTSQTDIMALNTYGLSEADITGEQPYYNEKIGWLSLLGYDGYLINPDTVNIGNWSSLLNLGEQVKSTLTVDESGSLDAYMLGWGMNISHNLYLGVSANIISKHYEKTSRYKETFAAGGGYVLRSILNQNGVGFNAGVGVIYRPLPWLRLGASFQSPTSMVLNESSYAYLTSDGVAPEGVGNPALQTPINHFTYDKYFLPLRAVGGVAFQVKQWGLVSLEYDYTDKEVEEVALHTFKLGTEWIVNKNIFFRAGYAYKSPLLKEDYQLVNGATSVRTDTDFRVLQHTQYISAGIGWRPRVGGRSRWIVDVTYQLRLNKANQYLYAHEGVQHTPLALDGQTHRVVFTLGWSN